MTSIRTNQSDVQGAPKKRLKSRHILGVVTILVGITCVIYWNRAKAPSSDLPERFRNLSTLESLGGRPLSRHFLSEPIDGVWVHYWATWCAPCAEELPAWVKWIESKPGRRGIAVSLDETPDQAKRALPEGFIRSSQIVWLVNPKRDVAESWGTYQLPETYQLKSGGELVNKWVGSQSWTK